MRILRLALMAGLAVALAPSNGLAAEGVHYVIAVSGKVGVKRPGRSGYAPIEFGAALGSQDVLSLDEGATATIACGDLSIHEVHRPSVTGVPCLDSAPPQLQPWDRIPVNPSRGNHQGLIPVVISPRMTKLLNPRPRIRWVPVPKVGSYEVSLDKPKWSTTVHGTELTYPDSAPALKPHQAYIFRIKARLSDLPTDVITSDEDAPDLGFTLLDDDKRDAVHHSEDRIEALPITGPAKRFLVACLYATNGLRAEALEILDGDLGTPANENVLYMAGELYRGSGLYEVAEAHYRAALTASQADDVDTKARVLESLALVYEEKGNQAEARTRWAEALAIYDKLGDQPSMIRVNGNITRLTPKEDGVQKKQ